ncbi:MAG: isoprenyl transferase [Phycisphaerae bacterium]|nr:isoprenyl transferase [Phycisphaerae bacterium]
MPNKHSSSSIAAARKHLSVDDDRIPHSVAIIMDGNGRWACQRSLPRVAGHQAGAKVVRKIVTEAARLGLEALTLYSFSLENWRRPKNEVDTLMHLYAEYLVSERPTLMENNIRLCHLGRRDGLPDSVLKELDKSLRVSAKNTGMHLCLALNYGSRMEVTDAVRRIADRVARNEIKPDQIDESFISSQLDTAGVPDPDLLIRTAGEMRLSNFLLWQLSYSEFYVTQTYWPDFNEAAFHEAIRAYAERHRRFGGLDNSNT